MDLQYNVSSSLLNCCNLSLQTAMNVRCKIFEPKQKRHSIVQSLVHIYINHILESGIKYFSTFQMAFSERYDILLNADIKVASEIKTNGELSIRLF